MLTLYSSNHTNHLYNQFEMLAPCTGHTVPEGKLRDYNAVYMY